MISVDILIDALVDILDATRLSIDRVSIEYWSILGRYLTYISVDCPRNGPDGVG